MSQQACAAASVALRGREHSEEHSAAVLMADERTRPRGDADASRGVALRTALQDAAAGGSVHLSTAIDRLGGLGIANVLPGLGRATVALAEGAEGAEGASKSVASSALVLYNIVGSLSLSLSLSLSHTLSLYNIVGSLSLSHTHSLFLSLSLSRARALSL